MTFFNTTGETGSVLAEYQKAAGKQEGKALQLFASNPHALYTPFEVKEAAFSEQTPITSVRRAITNLTSAGMLQKTGFKRKGPYDRPSFLWRLMPGLCEEAESMNQPAQRSLFG